MKLIEKSALVAEIDKRLQQLTDAAFDSMIGRNLIEIRELLDTLEVKEVDLEKEIEEHVLGMPMSEFTHDGEVEGYLDWAREEFRHFFELGLKAQKGE